ncbi:MAG TPA: hypothetical protein VNN73_20915 [Blastocatellia bacterium]|nr:hypothetical protein [Blastocatellia bacterium]
MLFGLANISATTKQEPPKLTKDGKMNPSSIPEHVAYEFFFKSLVSSPLEGDKGQSRIQAFARQTGIKDSQIEALLAEAQNVYRRISSFDRRIKSIKDQNWPNPEQYVWDQLKGIQEEKEAAIIEQSNAALSRLGAEVSGKLRAFINDYVKRRIKGYASEPNPGQEARPHRTTTGIVLATFLSPLTPVSLQMQGDETVYIYADAAYIPGNETVYGYGDVTATASSYGHEYSARTEMYGPCGQFYSSDSGFLGVPIEFCDGVYNFYCFAVQACPIANTIRDAGSSEDSAGVSPFVRVLGFGSFSPTSIKEGGDSSFFSPSYIPLTLRASTNANASVDIETSYQIASGSPPMTVRGFVNSPFNITGGQTVSKSIQYIADQITTDPTKIRAEAVVTSSVTVINGDQRSTSVLTINKR